MSADLRELIAQGLAGERGNQVVAACDILNALPSGAVRVRGEQPAAGGQRRGLSLDGHRGGADDGACAAVAELNIQFLQNAAFLSCFAGSTRVYLQIETALAVFVL